MRFIITFLLVFAVSATYAQDTVNIIEKCGLRVGHWKITGAMVRDSSYAPDEIVEEGDYTNKGQKTGLWTAYYPGGVVKSRINYFNNKPHGWMELYFSNGNIREQGKWSGSRWIGPYSRYYENGKTATSFNFNAVGQRDGRQVYYYETGTVMIEVYMDKGKEHGLKLEYNCRGELARETSWNQGVVIPEKTKSYRSLACNEAMPKPEPKPDTLRPKPDPPCADGHFTLYKNRQISQQGVFRNCKLIDGKEYIYDPNGVLLQIKVYKDGKYVGDSPLPE